MYPYEAGYAGEDAPNPDLTQTFDMREKIRFLLLMVLCAAACYIGSYFFMVRRAVLPAPAGLPRRTIEVPAEYWFFGRSIECDFATVLFAPIQKVDIAMRQDYWVIHNEIPTTR